MSKITFELDTPVVVHMMDLDGRERDSHFPPFDTYWMFEAEEGRFHLSDTQGGLFRARLKARGIEAGEPVTIIKTKPCRIRIANGRSSSTCRTRGCRSKNPLDKAGARAGRNAVRRRGILRNKRKK